MIIEATPLEKTDNNAFYGNILFITIKKPPRDAHRSRLD
jgi:hypothetical protein